MLGFGLIFFIILLDQVTKLLVVERLNVGENIVIVPGVFDLAYVRNTGAAWGMFGDFNGWLVLFSCVILVCLLVFRRFLADRTMAHRMAIALIAGGISGNLLDRMRLGYVVDFLDFYWGTHHFPAFNVADSAICVAVAIYAFSSWADRSDIVERGKAGPEKCAPVEGEAHGTLPGDRAAGRGAGTTA